MVNMDRITKQKLNVILIVDASTSMRGKRITEVNNAIREIKDYLINLESESSNVDFYLSILTFSTNAYWKNNQKEELVDNLQFQDIKAGGWSNLHLAYQELNIALKKESKGGIMPDFGGYAPIILLLTDGHPSESCRKELDELNTKPWFNVALRYGISIELNDNKTKKILEDFVGNNGDVIDCFDANKLKKYIKLIVLTASKVKSKSTSFISNNNNKPVVISQNKQVKQEIQTALVEVDNWEW